MRPRLLTIALLTVGFTVGSAGVASAVSGVTGDQSGSALAQYEQPGTATPLAPPAVVEVPETPVQVQEEEPATPPTPDEVEAEEQGGAAPGGEDEGGGVAPVKVSAPVAPDETRQLAAQVNSGNELPFTGFSVLWVLLAAAALLVAGLVLRRDRGASHR